MQNHNFKFKLAIKISTIFVCCRESSLFIYNLTDRVTAAAFAFYLKKAFFSDIYLRLASFFAVPLSPSLS